MKNDREFLIWPYEKYRESLTEVLGVIKNKILPLVNHILIDMDTHKFDEIKEGQIYGPKCEQSLRYLLSNWPKDHPRRVVIQAGGCLGLWPKVLSNYFDHVYTFEAQAEAFYLLSLNCPEKNITKLQAALGEKSGQFINIEMTNRPGQGRVSKLSGNAPMFALDDFHFPYCDALLLDVEGHEPQILRGAGKLLDTFKPYVLCEDNWNSGKIITILKSHGYELVTKANKDKIYKHKSKDWPGGQWDKHTKEVKK